MNLPSKELILEGLKAVIDPDFQKNIVELGFVENLEIEPSGHVSFDLVLTTPACPVKEQFVAQCKQIIQGLGATSVDVRLSAKVRRSTQEFSGDSLITQVHNIIGVASGKGGVGKSTVTTNLAMALSLSGARVGILDADIYGPSMGIMFDITEDPLVHEDRTLTPVTARGGIRIVSMSMFADAGKATIWRGPMASQMIQNFLHRVHWGELDYLFIDFPPGTGDIQLTLTQSCPLSGAVVVTTPQDVALADCRKGLAMFDAVNVPVLGIVENMSFFICDQCDKHHHIFRSGGGERIANQLGVPLLGKVPLEPAVADCGDLGQPVVLRHPNSVSSQVLNGAAGQIAAALSRISEEGQGLGTFALTWEEIPQEAPPAPLPSPTESTPRPLKISRTPSGRLGISWSNQAFLEFPLRKLRQKCPCASCVDEWSGEVMLDPESVPEDIAIEKIQSVGRYAIGIHWSDGHRSGIYTYERLYHLMNTSNPNKFV